MNGMGIIDLDIMDQTDLRDGGLKFWEALGEPQALLAPGGKTRIDNPLCEFVLKSGWDPMPKLFAERMRKLLTTDPLFLASERMASLGRILSEEFFGRKPSDFVRAQWAVKYLGMDLGERPGYDREAENSYWEAKRERGGRRGSYVRNPNSEYYAWRDRRNAASLATDIALQVVREYALRRIVLAEDFPTEKRHAILEFFVKTLARRLWRSLAGRDGNVVRHVEMSYEQFCSGGKEDLVRYLGEVADDLRAFAKYTRFDLSAVARTVGPMMPQMLALIESTAMSRIETRLAAARAELEQFSEAMKGAFGKGMLRRNEMTFRCVVFKYEIDVKIVDIGGGFVAANKMCDALVTSVEHGVTAAKVLFPPLVGFAALGVMVAAIVLEEKDKRR